MRSLLGWRQSSMSRRDQIRSLTRAIPEIKSLDDSNFIMGILLTNTTQTIFIRITLPRDFPDLAGPVVNVVTRRIIHPVVAPDTQNVRMAELTNWDPSHNLGDVIRRILRAFNNPIPTYVPDVPRSLPLQDPSGVQQIPQRQHATGVPQPRRAPLPPPGPVAQNTPAQVTRVKKAPEKLVHPNFFRNQPDYPDKATPASLPKEFPELNSLPMVTLTKLFDSTEGREAFLLQTVPELSKLRDEVKSTFETTREKVESLSSSQMLLSYAKEEMERQEEETKNALEEFMEIQKECQELWDKFSASQFARAYRQRANEEEAAANDLKEACFHELVDTSTRTMSNEEKTRILDRNYMLLRDMKSSMFEAYTKGHISRVKAEVLASKGFDL